MNKLNTINTLRIFSHLRMSSGSANYRHPTETAPGVVYHYVCYVLIVHTIFFLNNDHRTHYILVHTFKRFILAFLVILLIFRNSEFVISIRCEAVQIACFIKHQSLHNRMSNIAIFNNTCYVMCTWDIA